MKSIKILFLSILVLTFAATGAFAAKEGKMGFVNLNKIFNEYGKTAEYDKTLEVKHGEYEKERSAKVEKIKDAQAKLDLLKENEKAKLQEEIEQMRADLLEFDRQKTTDLTKERNEMTRNVLLEIEDVMNVFAEEKGYSFIFNSQFLIFGDPGKEVTEEVLERLNSPKGKK